MPCIVTSVHDPIALAETCRRFGLYPSEEGRVPLDVEAVFGWVVRLPGLHAPIVVNTLTGLVAYHCRDNAFLAYGRIARFILRYYHVRAVLKRDRTVPAIRPSDAHQRQHRPVAPIQRLIPSLESA